MIVYFTFNDSFSGIFSSQVIDVVKYLRSISEENIRLLSLISTRNFFVNRKKIKDELEDAIVLPMFPGVKNWKLNIYILYLYNIFYKPRVIISRGVFACNLSLKLKSKENKVIYDGRGAISAEWREYNIGHQKLIHTIYNIEKSAVLNSDYRIAVSNKLIEYWKDEFGYHSNHHVVIPCTLNKLFEEVVLSELTINKAKRTIGFKANDIVFVYSGSIAAWQSFNMLYDYISPILKSNTNYKLMFLSDIDENILKLQYQFPHQVICQKLNLIDVPKYLLASDYGLLLREETVTNRVASPVKFAEYIACGLKVIISDNLGDYSKFVETFDNGILNGNRVTPHEKVLFSDKLKIKQVAKSNFSKAHFMSQYNNLLINHRN